MDSARSWLNRFQQSTGNNSTRLRNTAAVSRKKDFGGGGLSVRGDRGGMELSGAAGDGGEGEVMSSVTKQRVTAAKQYIENHYKEQMKNLQERRER